MGIGVVERAEEGLAVVTDGPEARLCAAMGVLNAATAEVVASIAEALEDPSGWQGDAIATAEQWVALRCGVGTAGPGAWWPRPGPWPACRRRRPRSPRVR